MRGPPNQPGKCVPEEPSNQCRTPQRAQGSRTGSCTRDRANAAAQNQRHPKPQEGTRGPARRQDPRKRAQNHRSGGRQSGNGSGLDVPPHGTLGSLALTSATLVASTPTSSSGDSRLGDGGRGASETVCVKERVGPQGQERWEQRVQKRQRGAETLSRQHGEHEQHWRGAAGEAGLVGNSWWPSP